MILRYMCMGWLYTVGPHTIRMISSLLSSSHHTGFNLFPDPLLTLSALISSSSMLTWWVWRTPCGPYRRTGGRFVLCAGD
ncbi:hypothetical protein EON65_38185 [archaeon]|nr:MAG: hypothetical protein EON65_38185 [archaeon]